MTTIKSLTNCWQMPEGRARYPGDVVTVKDAEAVRLIGQGEAEPLAPAPARATKELDTGESNCVPMRGVPTVLWGVVSDCGAVKAVGPSGLARVGGMLVVFNSPDSTPWRDYFTPETDFGSKIHHPIPLLFHHGTEGDVDQLGDVVVSPCAGGLEAQGRLSLATPRGRALHEAVKRGRMGWSAGALAKRVKQKDGSHHVTMAHINEGSLTPIPCNPACVAWDGWLNNL
jgi:hypothetical protein